jgi:amino acid permease
MDFYSTKKRVNFVRIIVLIASVILLLFNLYRSYINGELNYLFLSSNILIIAAMTLGIYTHNKTAQ